MAVGILATDQGAHRVRHQRELLAGPLAPQLSDEPGELIGGQVDTLAPVEGELVDHEALQLQADRGQGINRLDESRRNQPGAAVLVSNPVAREAEFRRQIAGYNQEWIQPVAGAQQARVVEMTAQHAVQQDDLRQVGIGIGEEKPLRGGERLERPKMRGGGLGQLRDQRVPQNGFRLRRVALQGQRQLACVEPVAGERKPPLHCADFRRHRNGRFRLGTARLERRPG